MDNYLLKGTSLDSFNGDLRSLSWSSDNRKLVFLSNSYDTGALEVYTVNSDGTNLKSIVKNISASPYGRDYTYGDPIFVGNGDKVALLRTLSGWQSFREYGTVNSDGSGEFIVWAGGYNFTWSPDGTKLAQGAWDVRSPTKGYLTVINQDGNALNIYDAGFANDVGNIAWSPDGKKIAFTVGTPSPYMNYYYSLYVINSDGSDVSNISKPGYTGYSNPVWSPDGTKIAFVASGPTNAYLTNNVFVINADGSGEVQILTPDGHWSSKYGISGWKNVEVSAAANANPFTVQAADEVGTTFTVPAGATQCTFDATGTWKWDVPSAAVTADGIPSADYRFRIPTGNAFDLILQRSDGTFEHVGSSSVVNVTGGESLRFLMNDAPNSGGNSDELSVSWSCQ